MSRARKPVVALIVSSIGMYPIITQVIQNGVQSVRAGRARPIVVIAHDKPLPLEIVKAIKRIKAEIKFLPVSTRGMGHAVMAGFDYASKYSDAMVMLPDDYEVEARDVMRTAIPLLKGSASMSSGAWPYHTTFASSFSRPQYLTEIAVSRLLTFANPSVKISGTSFMASVNEAAKKGKQVHAYHGIHSIRSKDWPQCKKDIHHLFENQMDVIGRFSVDVAMALATYYRNKRVVTPSALRTTEHADPEPEQFEAIKTKRVYNFRGAEALFRVFLERTGQFEKIPMMEKVVHQTMRRTEKSPVRTRSKVWERLERMRKRPAFQETFPAIGKHEGEAFKRRYKGRRMV